MDESDQQEKSFSLVGGSLCLDFTNTAGSRRDGVVLRDNVSGYHDILSWARQAGAVSVEDAGRFKEEADRHPERAEEALDRAIALREALYDVFSSVADERPPEQGALDAFNRELAEAMKHASIYPIDGGYEWGWKGAELPLHGMLWPVARSAADLLLSGDLERVRECAGETCSWLFVDTSRNHSRRWCDMSDCGNRAKARRHYARQRGEK